MINRNYFKDVALSPAESRRLNALNRKLPRYFRRVHSVSWGFSANKAGCAASCRVHSMAGYFQARVVAERAGAAMDLAVDKIVKQRRRKRAKSVTRRFRSGRKLRSAA